MAASAILIVVIGMIARSDRTSPNAKHLDRSDVLEAIARTKAAKAATVILEITMSSSASGQGETTTTTARGRLVFGTAGVLDFGGSRGEVFYLPRSEIFTPEESLRRRRGITTAYVALPSGADGLPLLLDKLSTEVADSDRFVKVAEDRRMVDFEVASGEDGSVTRIAVDSVDRILRSIRRDHVFDVLDSHLVSASGVWALTLERLGPVAPIDVPPDSEVTPVDSLVD